MEEALRAVVARSLRRARVAEIDADGASLAVEQGLGVEWIGRDGGRAGGLPNRTRQPARAQDPDASPPLSGPARPDGRRRNGIELHARRRATVGGALRVATRRAAVARRARRERRNQQQEGTRARSHPLNYEGKPARGPFKSQRRPCAIPPAGFPAGPGRHARSVVACRRRPATRPVRPSPNARPVGRRAALRGHASDGSPRPLVRSKNFRQPTGETTPPGAVAAMASAHRRTRFHCRGSRGPPRSV
jgi:hypothetical protein